ncbi:hypothetical protein GCM10019059_40250 [Camelimonas fluminis]|uniref:EpsG family protein n=1 Tax=Camelimonas fluminis TaxID=1576911 RepID=A0ABV7UGK4_9HYPH|nr:EpsG family protein [Camelimonas fluminis]GHE77007.1 hypothetical protein GCM10019059_40250 [Camelimonas fluminis]
MIYIAITIILYLLRLGVAGRPRLNRQFYRVVLVALFLFSAFRYEVGCDWWGYWNQYEVASVTPLDELIQGHETVWWVILYYLTELNLPYPWANVISSAVAFAGMHVLAKRQQDPLGFLILLFPVLIINVPMSAIRQGAAIGLICVAMTRLLDGRAFAYAVWVLIATGFHSSAAIFFLLTPFVGRRVTRWRVIASVCLAIPGAYLLWSSNASEEAGSRYIGAGNEAFGAVFRLALLGLSGAYFYIFLRRAWKRESLGDYQVVSFGALAMIGAMGLLPVSTVIADRLGYYLAPVQTTIFARVPSLQSLQHRQIISTIPYAVLLLFLAVWTVLSQHFQSCYLPYRTWLFGLP